MSIKLNLATVVVVIANGCAASYSPPTSGPSAVLTVQPQLGPYLGSIVVGVFDERLNCVGERRIGGWSKGFLITNSEPTQSSIAANEVLAFWVEWNHSNYLPGGMIESWKHKAIFEFEPREGRRYQLDVQAENMPVTWLMSEVYANGDKLRVPMKLIEPSQQHYRSGMQHCVGNQVLQELY